MADHPITPPPELVQDWAQKAQLLAGDDPEAFAELLCNKAARWGADMEPEACCEWVESFQNKFVHAYDLRLVRRPKPPSLKEQALDQLRSIQVDLTRCGMGISVETIRRALEQLDD